MAVDRVIDTDGHVMEPDEMWARYLEPEFRPLAPRLVTDSQGRPRHFVGDELKPPVPWPPGGFDMPAGGGDAKIRLGDMDDQGITCSILFPTVGLYFHSVEDRRLQAALCRAYNDWMHDFCATDPARLVGAAVVPQTDVLASVAEARRAVRELGCRAVMLRPNPLRGRNLDDPYYDPLWEAIEELDVPVAFHEGTTQDVVQSGRDRFDAYVLRHLFSHPHEQQIACATLIVGGVLERHPGLRAVFLESGCGWIGHWLERMDEHLESWSFATAPLPQEPSAYFRRQCFISADPAEQMIAGVIPVVGEDSIVFATDYPHPDALADGIVERIAGRDDLSDSAKRKILQDNPARCFGI